MLAIPLIVAVNRARERARRVPVDTAAPILLYDGTGASTGDVKALASILDGRGLDYATLDTRRLNAMTEAQLRSHRLLIVPGGNFEVMGKALRPSASAAVRGAVGGGLHYLGFCAGAFLAGNSPYNGVNLTSGV